MGESASLPAESAPVTPKTMCQPSCQSLSTFHGDTRASPSDSAHPSPSCRERSNVWLQLQEAAWPSHAPRAQQALGGRAMCLPFFPQNPPTPPPPPTTSKPREMQRPGFLGCPERLSEQGLARWSGLGWLSLPGCGVASASSSFLPDRRCRAASGDNGCWKQCYKLFDYTVNISLLLLLAVISFLQRRKLLSYSVPRLQRVQRGCIALSLSRGSVFNASFLYLHNGSPLLVVTPPRPQLCLSGQSVNCVFLASKFSCLCSKRWAQISISS